MSVILQKPSPVPGSPADPVLHVEVDHDQKRRPFRPWLDQTKAMDGTTKLPSPDNSSEANDSVLSSHGSRISAQSKKRGAEESSAQELLQGMVPNEESRTGEPSTKRRAVGARSLQAEAESVIVLAPDAGDRPLPPLILEPSVQVGPPSSGFEVMAAKIESASLQPKAGVRKQAKGIRRVDPIIKEPQTNAAIAAKPAIISNAAQQQDGRSSRSATRVKDDAKATASTAVISSRWPKSVGIPKRRMLRNPGCFCYRRSTTQALFALPQFYNLLDTHKASECKSTSCVTCATRSALVTYHSSEPPQHTHQAIVNLDHVIRIPAPKAHPKWTSHRYVEEDAQEFLAYLLNTMELAKCLDKTRLSQVFHLAQRVSWTCQQCKEVSSRTEPSNWGISLPIPPPNQSGSKGAVTLHSCLDAYHHEPQLSIRCDKCRSDRPRSRRHRIEVLPEVLIVHLLRFDTQARKRARKNNVKVDTPENLDVAPWAVKGVQRTKYILHSAVIHGGGLEAGHYVTRARDMDGGVWEFDDEAQPRRMKSWWSNLAEFNPYILFYVRQ